MNQPIEKSETNDALHSAEEQAIKYGRDLAAMYRVERERRAELQSTVNFVRSIIDHMSDGLLAANAELKIVECNARAHAMLATKENLAGRQLSEVLNIPGLDAELQAVQARALHDPACKWESDCRPQADNECVLSVVAKPPGTVGRVWTVLLRDVTAEFRLKTMRREILTLLGYQLRSPLNHVAGLADLLSRSADGDSEPLRADLVDGMRLGVQRLHRSLNELLEAAEISTNGSISIQEMVSVPSFVEKAVASFEYLARAKNVSLNIQGSEIMVTLRGDSALLQRAVEEIIRNALYFTASENQVIVGYGFDQNSRKIKVTVDDDGPGINFKGRSISNANFSRGGTENNEGLGLGLTLVRHVAQMHGGEALIQASPLLRGTRVTLALSVGTVDTRTEVESLKEEVELLQRQNMAYALDLSKTYSQRRSTERKLAVSRDQMARSAKLAEIGKMASAIAHDLSNILAPITGYSGLLLMQADLSEKARTYATRIQQSMDRSTDMLRKIKEFGTPSLGTQKLVSVEEIVRAATGLLAYGLKKSGVLVHVELQPNLPPINADASQIEQVLVNLMVNARDAMKPAGGVLRISAAHTESGVVLSVKDNGPGIAPEHQADIFEPFSNAISSGTGSGLGLFVCKEIINQHNAVMEMISEIGSGTEFKITFSVQP
jgi:signal transduction histidine kinase